MTDTKTAEHYTALAAQVKAERADMLLRANAWALLDALQEVLLLHIAHHNHPIHAAARAAIAKAKGEA